MLDNTPLSAFKEQLFSDRAVDVYAVIDGAAVKELRYKIWKMQPESCCLWAGELAPDMQEVAPYLIKLEKYSEFTDWLMTNGWGENWGIYLSTHLNFKQIRKHLRKFLVAKGANGETLLFRFYDPRVMAVFDHERFADQGLDFSKPMTGIYINLQNTWTQCFLPSAQPSENL